MKKLLLLVVLVSCALTVQAKAGKKKHGDKDGTKKIAKLNKKLNKTHSENKKAEIKEEIAALENAKKLKHKASH